MCLSEQQITWYKDLDDKSKRLSESETLPLVWKADCKNQAMEQKQYIRKQSQPRWLSCVLKTPSKNSMKVEPKYH